MASEDSAIVHAVAEFIWGMSTYEVADGYRLEPG
jgi:hypothetical protein